MIPPSSRMFDGFLASEVRATVKDLRLSIDESDLPRCHYHWTIRPCLVPQLEAAPRYKGNLVFLLFECSGSHFRWLCVGQVRDDGAVVFFDHFAWLEKLLWDNNLTL